MREVDEMKNEFFVDYFNDCSNRAFQTTKKNGFWNDGEDKNFGEIIALIHSELSEALEAKRAGDQQSKDLPQYNNVVLELADAVIRIMVYCHGDGLQLASAIVDKIEFNKSREYKHGGKEF